MATYADTLVKNSPTLSGNHQLVSVPAAPTVGTSGGTGGGGLLGFLKRVPSDVENIGKNIVVSTAKAAYGTTDPFRYLGKIIAGEVTHNQKAVQNAQLISPHEFAGDVLQTAALGLPGGKLVEKGSPLVRALLTGARIAPSGAAYGAGSGIAAGETPKQIVKSAGQGALFTGALGAGGSLLGQAISRAKLAKASGVQVPASALDKFTEAETKPAEVINTPKGEKANIPGQEGYINPSAVVSDTKALLNKHQVISKATGDITEDYSKLQGRTKDIKLDVARTLEGRAPLSDADKQLLQDYRDAKAAGLKPTPLPDRLKAADATITELNKAAQAADAEKARLSGNEAQAQKIEARDPETYTHLIAQEKGSGLERTLQGDRKNPLSVSSLGKVTAGSKKQTFLNATDENGVRQTVAVKDGKVTALSNEGKTAKELGNLNLKSNAERMTKELEPVQRKIDSLEREQKTLSATKSRTAAAKLRLANIKKALQEAYRQHANITNKYDINELENKTFVGKDGKKYTLSHATQVEKTANTGQKYYVDPELTTYLNYADSKVSLENTRFIENTKSILEDKGLAVKEGESVPKGFESTKNPYFQGYKLTPKLAEMLDDIAGRTKSSVAGEGLDAVSNVLRQTIVYLPLRHDFNIGTGYFIDRGLAAWMNPAAYVRMGQSLKEAYTAVATQNEFYRKLLRSGTTMMGDDGKLAKVVKTQIKDTADNKEFVTNFAKTFGIKTLDAYKKLQQVSVWDVQNILNAARVAERMKPTLLSKGMSFEDAVKATEKYNFQYKVPSRVILPGKAGRAIAETLGSDKLYFGTYTYDKFRIAKNIVKGTLNPKTALTKPSENLEAASKLAATVAIATVIWPLVDKGLQAVSGDKNAHVTAPGVASVAELVKDEFQGTKGAAAIAGQFSIAAPYTLGSQIFNNVDSFTGNRIWDPNASEATKVATAAKWAVSQLAPVQKATTSKNAPINRGLSTFLSLAGVSLPKNSPLANKLNSLKYDSLPGVQTKARNLGKTGNTSGAQSIIDSYNRQVLSVAKADLKDEGKSVPDDNSLINMLKKSGYWYQPQASTIAGWSQSTTPVSGGFSP